MDAGGLAQMTYPNGFPSAGVDSNNRRMNASLPRLNPNAASQAAYANLPTPRTSRSHLLAGLRTAPKSPSTPASAPFSSYQGAGMDSYSDSLYSAYTHRNNPQTTTATHFPPYTMSDQVLAPPTFFEQEPDLDPHYVEQLQMTSLFLAQRQQQLQQQLANISAAATHQQYNGMYAQQAMSEGPMEVPGQPGLFVVMNPVTGQYQYVMDNNSSPGSNGSPRTPGSHQFTAPNKLHQYPTFRAEISPPPSDRLTPGSRGSPKQGFTPPGQNVVPLPPPSANAFRRGHNKTTSLATKMANSGATNMYSSPRSAVPGSSGGYFGPGAARAGEHPIRQPRGPPNLEELIALPTSKHEGSKNFAMRQRRHALDSLVRAGSVRRAVSGSQTAPSESELSFRSEADEPCARKQSPIGYERRNKRSSQSSLEGGAVQTPGSEKSDAFDMSGLEREVSTASPSLLVQERKRVAVGGA